MVVDNVEDYLYAGGMEMWKPLRFPLLHTHNYVIAPHTIIRGVYQHFPSGAFLHQTPVWVVYHF